MREILFKAKRIDNGEWAEGGFFKTLFGKKQFFIVVDTEIRAKFFEVIPETVCQFTGLKDKDGVKIFEGDIVECNLIYNGGSLPHQGEIVYDNIFGAFATKNLSGITLLHHLFVNSFKVIGSIHDKKAEVANA